MFVRLDIETIWVEFGIFPALAGGQRGGTNPVGLATGTGSKGYSTASRKNRLCTAPSQLDARKSVDRAGLETIGDAIRGKVLILHSTWGDSTSGSPPKLGSLLVGGVFVAQIGPVEGA